MTPGLDRPTVTPGSAPPVASWTVPLIAPTPWAIAGVDANTDRRAIEMAFGNEADIVTALPFGTGCGAQAVRSSKLPAPHARAKYRLRSAASQRFGSRRSHRATEPLLCVSVVNPSRCLCG